MHSCAAARAPGARAPRGAPLAGPACVALAYRAPRRDCRWRATCLMTVQSSSNVLLSSTPGLHVVVDAERALKRPRRPEERMLLAGCDVSDPLDSASAIPRATRDPRPAPRAPGSGGARSGGVVPTDGSTARSCQLRGRAPAPLNCVTRGLRCRAAAAPLRHGHRAAIRLRDVLAGHATRRSLARLVQPLPASQAALHRVTQQACWAPAR